MTKRSFIITVDTEGDNLWAHRPGDTITTRNAEFVPRFQALCNEFGFKPVYLTNYEMAQSTRFVAEARQWLAAGECEVGVHLHAWNNPPLHPLANDATGQAYLIEYPVEVMRAKFDVIYNLLRERFGITPITHRAGRWAMNDDYFAILRDYGIKVDCSVTPHINWNGSMGATRAGSDYSRASIYPSVIDGVLEVPMTVVPTHLPISGSWRHRIKTLVTGTPVMLRPALESASTLRWVIDRMHRISHLDYVEFMIHSSELMPGGSPYTPTGESVERVYIRMRSVFEYATSLGYEGHTLEEYYRYKTKQSKKS